MGRVTLLCVLALVPMLALLGALDTAGEAVWEERAQASVAARAPSDDDTPSGSELDLIGPRVQAWPTR